MWTGINRKVNEDSILAIQIFDQKKFKKKDQGFLGVINVRIGDVIDLQMGGDGIPLHVSFFFKFETWADRIMLLPS